MRAVKASLYFSIPVALLAAVALGITSHLKHECSYTTVHIVGNKIVGAH
jgi:hypothetical protein